MTKTHQSRTQSRRGSEGPEPSPKLVDLGTKVFESAIQQLAINEGEIPGLCRRILRMRRDKEDMDEILRLSKPLFLSIVGSCINQIDRSDNSYSVKPTPELKSLLRNLNQGNRKGGTDA